MKREVKIVKITKCTSDKSWYKDYIGYEFRVVKPRTKITGLDMVECIESGFSQINIFYVVISLF